MTRIKSCVAALEPISNPICSGGLGDLNDFCRRLAALAVRPNHKPFENPWEQEAQLSWDANQRLGVQCRGCRRKYYYFLILSIKFHVLQKTLTETALRFYWTHLQF